jgi:hypothetical protein
MSPTGSPRCVGGVDTGAVSIARELILSSAHHRRRFETRSSKQAPWPNPAVFSWLLSNRILRKHPRRVNSRQHSRHATDGSSCVWPRPMFTGLLRPATAPRGALQHYCGLLQSTAQEGAGFPCMRPFNWPSPRNVSGRLQAAGGAAAKVESSRRTRRRHIRPRSCTARWSCFRTSIFSPNPAAARLAVPEMAAVVDSHLRLTWKSGEAQTVCGGGKYARAECDPQAPLVSWFCSRSSPTLPID